LSLQEISDMALADREVLTKAVKSLEHPSLAARLTNLVGKPIELIGYALPSFASKAVASATKQGWDGRSASQALPNQLAQGQRLRNRARRARDVPLYRQPSGRVP
jgi:hypothetical protein